VIALFCIEIVSTIPDNEAETAAATLRRLGVPAERLERADLYKMEVEPGNEADLLATLSRIETIYNPNKHALHVRRDPNPGPGEVWVHEIAHEAPASRGPVRIAGRTLPGVKRLERYTAWRLADAAGAPASEAMVARATETLLCNPAFQKASI
jgi:phosphoribosylformylglycinamidine (FGAM) synthase PurS component